MSNSLKEAFLNLASSLGHCQENSRSIVDVLKRGCSDLADNAEGGGSSQDYSAEEHIIGKWIDGTTNVYEKTVDCGTLPNNSTKNVAHSISGIGYVVSIQGSAKNPDSGLQIPLPYVYGNTKCLQTYIDATNIKLISTENMATYTESYVTIRYTKA